MTMLVKQPGLLSLLQDSGRFGVHQIGLTNGGPLDQQAYAWANRLLGNQPNACAIEVSFGGLQLQTQVDTYIAVTGAPMALIIDGVEHDLWTSHKVTAGAHINLGFCQQGARAYLAVAGGFQTPIEFGSRSTVVRENIGGLQQGQKLTDDDRLACTETKAMASFTLPAAQRPTYTDHTELRVVLGYQHDLFSLAKQALFFSSTYTLTDRADRMGMRLSGPDVSCDTTSMLSEGICYGAIQIPADGQPIVLLNDRQTIGGYPKIGSVISQDAARLAQLRPGDTVTFKAVDLHQAQNIYALAAYRFQHTPLEAISE